LPDANGLLLLFLLTNEAEALIKLGDNKAGRRAFESAVRVVATDSPNANMAVAKHASEIGYEHDAVEFFARYLLLTSGRTRGDLPAVEVIRSIPEEASIVMAHRTELADCVRRVTAEWDAPISGDPDDDVNPRIRLEPEAWGRFARLAGLTSGA
jgi:hypothetical protein